jgi:predicted anti-sigma-YlaC factor YlaD
MGVAVSECECVRARRALSLVLDLEAEDADARQLATHLGRCASCRRFAWDVSAITRQLRLMRDAYLTPNARQGERGRS